jgi:hypothetical protein
MRSQSLATSAGAALLLAAYTVDAATVLTAANSFGENDLAERLEPGQPSVDYLEILSRQGVELHDSHLNENKPQANFYHRYPQTYTSKGTSNVMVSGNLSWICPVQ